MKSKKFILLILIPAFLHLAIFMLLPILGNGVMSFMDYNPLRAENDFIGFQNYSKLFGDELFYKALSNTLVFVVVSTVVNIIISLTIATLISQLKSNRSRSFFRMVVFLPCVAPLVASSIVWGHSVFRTNGGLLNMIVKAFEGTPVNWVGDANYLMFAVILFTIWADVGYNIILFSAGLDGIPSEFLQASEIDGAGKWKQFRHVTLPLLGRTTAFVVIMTLISYFQMFAQFNTLVQMSGPQNSGLVLTSYIYRTAFVYKDMGYASAISMAFFVLILIVTLIQQRLSKVKWEY